MADASTLNPMFELWRKQFEESAAAWTRMVGQAPPPPSDPTAFWRPILNQGLEQWARLFAQTPMTPDLATQWKQFMDQWIEAWSKALGQAMNTEAYAQMMGKYLDQWLVANAPMKKAAEQRNDQALQVLNLAWRTQLTAVAKQVVQMEARLGGKENNLEAIVHGLHHKKSRL